MGAAKFCGECGTPFADPISGNAAPAPARMGEPTPVAERRLVSVLFADLVGFTPFAEERDAEDVRETLSRYFDLASDVIGRYGGTVEKFIGDAVMAVWGTPVAQEDDAERSVRAALELADAVRRLGPGIQARVGVLSGEAAVTLNATNQGMVAGDLVNVAARLQSIAEPGTVLVGEPTMRATSAAIAFESIGEQSLKGKAARVRAWRAVRVIAERGGRGRTDTLEAPFVGRDDETHLLKELFHATGREGRIRLVSVMGAAGIGKSRLTWEFEKYADGVTEEVWWHVGRSPSYGEGITFWALGEMIRRRARLAADDDEATTRERIAATVREHVPDPEEQAWIEPALLALLGIGAERSGSEQMFAAWRTFFERMAATGTVALVFEDLHWADAGTLDFIEHLLEWSRSSPIFIITLARPELLDRRPGWGAGQRNFTSLYLEPLDDAHMRELLDGLVPGVPSGAVDAIVARADGVPLYAVETVRTLLAEGRLTLEGDRYVPNGDLSQIAVPESLHALIAARLDALPAEARRLITHAAVLGQSFTLAGLAAVTGDPEEAVQPRVQDLARRELLVQNRDQRSPEHGQYAFVQGLIREVAYGMLARRDRKARHLAAARHFESLDTEEVSGALAVHYLAAHENATDEAEAAAIGAQARVALKAAAERASALCANGQAVAYLRQALPLATEPAEEALLRLQAGRAAARAAHHEEALAMLERAVELGREIGEPERTAAGIAALGGEMLNAGDSDGAKAMLLTAAAEFDDAHQPEVAAIHGQLSRAYLLLSDWPAALEYADRVLPAAEALGLWRVLADTLVTRGTALSGTGRFYEGLAVIQAGRALAREHGFGDTEIRAILNGSLMMGYIDPPEALRQGIDGLALAERLGVRMPILAMNASEVARPIGEWQRARDLLAEHLATELEGVDLASLTAATIALEACVGALEPGAMADLERLTRGLASGELLMHQARAEIAFAGGSLADARQAAEWIAQRDPLNAPPMLILAAHAAAWERDAESLSRIREAYAALPVSPRYLAVHRTAIQAADDALAGRRREALAGFRQAATELEQLGVPVDRALNAIDMAATLGPDDPDVRSEVARARTVLEGLGAGPYLGRLDAVLGDDAAALRRTAPARQDATVDSGQVSAS
jgi:class 3 adenylate cyclase/tetratricopeptide (TPR) repeat protein